jgi:hypothetical protein
MRAMDSPVTAPPHEAGPELEDQILVRPTPGDRTSPITIKCFVYYA